MLRALVETKAFWSGDSRWSLIKSPVHLAVGACRQLDMAQPPLAHISRWLVAAGQTLFELPSNGEAMWPGGTAWVSPADRLLVRYQLPAVLGGRMPEFGLTGDRDAKTASRVEIPRGDSWQRASTSSILERLDAAPGVALAPRAADATQVIQHVMTSPQYQLA
jgi:hypothetical protein